MHSARHLVLVGPMGAGKTSIGRCLARHFGLEFADSDHEVERRTGTSIPTIFECVGEPGFRAREREVLAALLAGPDAVIATGGGAVLDSGNRRLLADGGFVVYLRADVPAQLQRLERDRTRPLLAAGDREATLRRLADERGPLYADVADFAFDTTALSTPEAAKRLAAMLEAEWRGHPAGPRAEPAA